MIVSFVTLLICINFAPYYAVKGTPLSIIMKEYD